VYQVDAFAARFDTLVVHTRAHLDAEENRRRQCGFPAFVEHTGEHRRVLGELTQISRQVAGGWLSRARACIRQDLPQWFRLHLATMDGALAAHWKRRAAGG